MRTTVLLALLVTLVSAGALAGPKIAVDLATYDFPDTAEGIAVAHTFVLSNTGDQELVIQSVVVGCHCTTTTLDKDHLQPGESVGLNAMLDTEGLSGRVVRSITVTSNDPGPYGDYKLNLGLAGNVTERPPYETSVSDLFYDSYILLDVRDPVAYDSGHLVGALNVPATQLMSSAALLPPGTLTIVYDQDGSTSSAAVQTLQAGGVAMVRALRGGITLWEKTYGLARVVSAADSVWGHFLDVSGARAYSTSAAVQSYEVTQLQSDYVLIDIRSASAFAAGHLAGAVNVPEDDISAFVAALPRVTPVIVYGADSSDTDRLASTLWMGGSRVRGLLGGLAEWQKQHGNYLVVASGG